MLVKYNYKKNINTYQIFIPDVDGLINGSPVRLMGINIGYVSQINIVGEDVYVKFIVTEPNVKIPYGSKVTVEFSGLGGSKSLELYPPAGSKSSSDKFLVTQAPKRIHDSLGLLNDMFDQLIDITYNISHFMDKVGMLKKENALNSRNTKTAEELLNASNKWLDKAQKQNNRIFRKINGEKDESK